METKTITITTLLTLLVGSGAIFLFTDTKTGGTMYYCESNLELGPKECNINGLDCTVGEEVFTCETGWVQIKQYESGLIYCPSNESFIPSTCDSMIDAVCTVGTESYTCNEWAITN